MSYGMQEVLNKTEERSPNCLKAKLNEDWNFKKLGWPIMTALFSQKNDLFDYEFRRSKSEEQTV